MLPSLRLLGCYKRDRHLSAIAIVAAPGVARAVISALQSHFNNCPMISGCFGNPRVRPKGAEGGCEYSDAELCYTYNITRKRQQSFTTNCGFIETAQAETSARGGLLIAPSAGFDLHLQRILRNKPVPTRSMVYLATNCDSKSRASRSLWAAEARYSSPPQAATRTEQIFP